MEPVSATPTTPQDYAAVSAAYAAAAGAIVLAATRRRSDPVPPPGEFLVYGLGTAALARMLAKEKVTAWIRAPFVDEPPEGERHPRGGGMRYTVGELLTCTRCLGSWSALGLLGFRTVAPGPARIAASLLALKAVNDVVQAGMTCVQARASHEEAGMDSAVHGADRVNGQPAAPARTG